MKRILPFGLLLIMGCGPLPVPTEKPHIVQEAVGIHDPTVVIVGDSTVNAWLTPQVLAANPLWVAQGSPPGVVEETSSEVLLRFPAAVALHPNVIVILAGVWDMAPVDEGGGYLLCTEEDNYPSDQTACQNFIAMVQQAQAAGIYVIIGTLPPWGEGPLSDEIGSDPLRVGNIAVFDDWLETEWANQGVTIADFHAALSLPGEPGVDEGAGQVYVPADTDDGVSPNAAGGQAMTTVAQQAITAAKVGGAR